MPAETRKIEILRALDQKVKWLSSWMIHNANHIRPNRDGVKVGGHQASSASSATILSALYFDVMRPQDRIAVKPHASPAFHAIQYILGRQTRDKLEAFRAYKGAQSYPSRTKDTSDADFSTGSVGLGVAQTIFASLVQDYVTSHGLMKNRSEGRMIALLGDAELDEGNIHEALIEGWKQGLRNCWWIIDYNRQSLDAVVHEDLYKKFETMFANYGWHVVVIKYGKALQAAFTEAGGDALRRWIDSCPNQLYAALCFQGGAAFRNRLQTDLAQDADALALLAKRSDEQLLDLMSNLGGHDLESLLEAFHAMRDDKPVCFIAYTVKGIGLPFQGHKDNHSGLMSEKQMEAYRTKQNVRPGHEWDRLEGISISHSEIEAFLAAVPFAQVRERKAAAEVISVPAKLEHPQLSTMSTQQGFGLILNALARCDHELAKRIVTTSPDVTVSTNLGSWVNRRGLYAREELIDVFRQEKIPSSYSWDYSAKGQHFELGIAEMNLFLQLSALGLSHEINGTRLFPIGTVYDPFIERGLDALNYACYQDSRFMIAGTPSGITLAPEGGAHQSIKTPLIGLSQPGLATFEPAYVDELAAIMAWGFGYMQQPGPAGGSVYMRLSTRPLAQVQHTPTALFESDVIAGGYWHQAPSARTQVAIAYMGALAPEALAAAKEINERGIDSAVLAITSVDRLFADWRAAQGEVRDHEAHIARLLSALPQQSKIVCVLDGHPATLAWLGSVAGHKTRTLGVDRFGESGSVPDLYAAAGIDAAAIVQAAMPQAHNVRRAS